MMLSKKDVLFCAVALATLLAVQAKILRSSNAMERGEKCDKILKEACPGTEDKIPFAYAPDPQKIDESCSAASTLFPCFKDYISTCEPEDSESLYYLTYLDVCDSTSHLYDGVRKTVKCMKIAEKEYYKTCSEPDEKLESKLTEFESKISDHGISADVWEKLKDGLTTRQSMFCYLRKTLECDKVEGTNTFDICKELYNRFGDGKRVAYLQENLAMVDTILNNLNLEDEQKKMLRGTNY